MDLLDSLLVRSPQLGANHPLPHGLPAHFNIVFLGQILRSQRRPEFPVHRLQQNRYCLLFRVGTDLAVGRKSSQRVSHDFVATAFQLPQQAPHVPFRDPQFCCCLLLGGRHRSGSQEARRRSQ